MSLLPGVQYIMPGKRIKCFQNGGRGKEIPDSHLEKQHVTRAFISVF